MKFQVNDKVIVLSGKDKGKTGLILRFSKDKARAVVGGINMHKKHLKASDRRPGGIIPQEAPVAISNLSIICPNCEKKTRVGHKLSGDKGKERICKKCNQSILFVKETKKK
ncbi:MAG: 50S ribosomal protein L24 [Candidatus Gracilibacteria bacterium]|nr:50S ribosomal protein L24 [Candidatus Gracilibacteria bacterium]